ncbi:MAG: aspartate kinase [Bacteroidetes bacterium QS_7_67_15]|nr:MAG: aspartate kinase [Bacteroidetes bacterium QS_7_67_15]
MRLAAIAHMETSQDAASEMNTSKNGTPNRRVTVMKFGGTSVGRPERMRQVARIVKTSAAEGRPVVVASALSGVTRQLDAALEDVAAGRLAPEQAVEAMRERHTEHAAAVLPPEGRERYESLLERELARYADALRQAATSGATPELRDRVLATGELCSVPLLAEALRAEGLNVAYGVSTELFVTDDAFGKARVDRDATAKNVRGWFAGCADEAIPLLAGYVGSTPQGQTTTLGFEGSDYSAALVAAFLRADAFERWTDVDGLFTADPNADPDAEHIDELTMEQAARLNDEGGLGMHPKALRPLLEAGIPAHIRCTTKPEGEGTRIRPEGVLAEERG